MRCISIQLDGDEEDHNKQWNEAFLSTRYFRPLDPRCSETQYPSHHPVLFVHSRRMPTLDRVLDGLNHGDEILQLGSLFVVLALRRLELGTKRCHLGSIDVP